jgi:hypothetical protein
MDDLKAPFSAPTSSFVLDDEATEGSRAPLPTPAATASTEQQTTASLGVRLTPPQPALAEPASAQHRSQTQQLQALGAMQAAAQTQQLHAAQRAAAVVVPPTGTTPQHEDVIPPAGAAPASYSTSQAAGTAAPTATEHKSTEELAGNAEEPAALLQAPPAIVDVLGQLAGNAADIRAAEVALQELLAKQHSLRLLMRKLEQQRVIEAVTKPLGFYQGRPVAAVLLLR